MPDGTPWKRLDCAEHVPVSSERGLSVASACGAIAPPDDEEVRRVIAASYALLGRRPYSRRELEKRLRRDFASAEIVQAALDWLEAKHYLDDRQLAEDAVKAAGARRGWGRQKVKRWLMGRGIDGAVATEALQTVDAADEAAQAAALAARQRDRGKRSEQIFRFLVSRGFPMDVARQAALDGRLDEE